jgi:hypothetical protein
VGVPAAVGVRPQRGPGRQRALPARCRQRCDLREWVVGLPGLEPGTSSLSGIDGRAPCYRASSQATSIRECLKDGVKHNAAASQVTRGHRPWPLPRLTIVTAVHGYQYFRLHGTRQYFHQRDLRSPGGPPGLGTSTRSESPDQPRRYPRHREWRGERHRTAPKVARTAGPPRTRPRRWINRAKRTLRRGRSTPPRRGQHPRDPEICCACGVITIGG